MFLSEQPWRLEDYHAGVTNSTLWRNAALRCGGMQRYVVEECSVMLWRNAALCCGGMQRYVVEECSVMLWRNAALCCGGMQRYVALQ